MTASPGMTVRDGAELSLVNDGQLSLFFIGCGSAFSKRLYQNNLLIIKGRDHVLIDCGTRTPQALHELGMSVTDIDTFLITHSHADHVGGLEEVMLLGRYVVRRKPTVIITSRYQRLLWNHSLRGGCASNEEHDGRLLQFEDFWKVVRPKRIGGTERAMYSVRVGGIKLDLFRTKHFPEQSDTWRDSTFSVGAVIDDRVLFTGDTQYDPALIAEMEGRYQLDVIFHDVQFFTGGVHASLEEISNLPAASKEKTYLMHYSDSFQEYEGRAAEAGFAGFARQWTYYDFP